MKTTLTSARRLLSLALILTLANAAGALVPHALPRDFLMSLSVINLLGCIALALEALYLGRLRSEASAPSVAPAAKPLVQREERTRQELAAFLGLLQEKGRLVDFVMEDIGTQPDARIGQVARVVHQGCRDVLKKYFDLVPAASAEGSTLDIGACKAEEIRLVGSVGQSGARSGVVLHPGWISRKIDLPEISRELPASPGAYLVSPAEVEVKNG
jgi:hypothetical protein